MMWSETRLKSAEALLARLQEITPLITGVVPAGEACYQIRHEENIDEFKTQVLNVLNLAADTHDLVDITSNINLDVIDKKLELLSEGGGG